MSIKTLIRFAALMILFLFSASAYADPLCSRIEANADCVNAGCQWCDIATGSFCRDADIPCTCYNGTYDSSAEDCESDWADPELCRDCTCISAYEPDDNGGCQIEDCQYYPSGTGCQADANCRWCATEQICIDKPDRCSLCRDIGVNNCESTEGCYWCPNQQLCLPDGDSCTCGDGYKLVSEECDDGIDAEHCVDCECVTGYEPNATGGCRPVCNPACENGWCTDINVCTCQMGWEGDTCDASSCDPAPCTFSCSDYDKDNCKLYDECNWCRSTQSCMGTQDDCPACNELPDEATCQASEGFCTYCSEASTDPCRRSNVPCTCFNGQYDADDETCEDDLGDPLCNGCKCTGYSESDGNGGCTPLECTIHSASEATCRAYSDCHFCEVEGLCKNVETDCILCEDLTEEYCDYGLTCYWCRNKNLCLDDGDSCTCGDGYKLVSEDCDDGIDPEHCVDCECVAGYEPNATGGCRPACDPPCENGWCTDVNICTCHMGWEGDTCDASSCDPAPCTFSCSDYDKDNCKLYDECNWCRPTQSCMGAQDDCPACNELPDETACLASDGFCTYCSGASTDPCRRSNVSCTCFNGQYDAGEEACEEDLGDPACTNCKCTGMTQSDGEGGCIRTDCFFYGNDASTCNTQTDCRWCATTGTCENAVSCMACEDVPDEYCGSAPGCYWCDGKDACLTYGESCTCGDGSLLASEQCDDGIDPDGCRDCLCTTGYEPQPEDTGACMPVCDPACVEGSCTAPGICVCEDGWIGATCDRQTCFPECSPDFVCEPATFICYLPGALVINELDIDQPGGDLAEFVELKNEQEQAVYLGDYDLVLVDGATGEPYTIIELDETWLDPGDYFVVCHDAEAVANCDQVYDASDNFIEDGAPDAVALALGQTVIDTVSYEGDSPVPYTEGSGAGLEDPEGRYRFGLSRYPDGSDTNENNVDFSGRCVTPGTENTAFSEHCTCGDHNVDEDTGEECDDGNRDNNDGCDENCRIETGYCESDGGYRCAGNVLEVCDGNTWTVVEDCSDSGSTCTADGLSGQCAGTDGDMDIETVESEGETVDGDIIDGNEDSEAADGDVTDGDVADSEAVDGDATDSEAVEGDATDGDVPDSEAVEGDATDGDVPDSEAVEGDATDGDEDSEAVEGDATDGDVPDSDAADADITDGDVADGDAVDGDVTGDDETGSDGPVADGDEPNIDGNGASDDGGCNTATGSVSDLWGIALLLMGLMVIRKRTRRLLQ